MRPRRPRRDVASERLVLTNELKEQLLQTLRSEGWLLVAVPALQARATQIRSDLSNPRLTLEEIRVLQGRHAEIERVLNDPMRALSNYREGNYEE